MFKFKVGDKVKRKDGDFFSNGEKVLTVSRILLAHDSASGFVVVFEETGTNLHEDALELAEIPFTKSDLKDGMVVTCRNGQTRISFDGKLYNMINVSCSSSLKYFNDDLTYLKYFNDDLIYPFYKDVDIIKVEYMGEVLWERKEEPKKVKLELEVTPEQAEMIKKQLGV